jgi:hypothetical protein
MAAGADVASAKSSACSDEAGARWNHAANKKGNDRRTLSAIEQDVMADIGYHVNFQDPAPYAPPVAQS